MCSNMICCSNTYLMDGWWSTYIKLVVRTRAAKTLVTITCCDKLRGTFSIDNCEIVMKCTNVQKWIA
uniref:Uncharacterized protein n=1 Tax=Arundo donax TaxID=35708 RepID=A0A0A9CB65_ARUDO